MESNQPLRNPQMMLWWVVWFVMQTSVIVTFFVLKGHAASPEANSNLWLIAVAPVAVSAVVRWTILLRLRNPAIALPLFVVGLAMAEATNFMGLFIFPQHRLELFILSALGVFQFIPIYLKRFFDGPDTNQLRGD